MKDFRVRNVMSNFLFVATCLIMTGVGGGSLGRGRITTTAVSAFHVTPTMERLYQRHQQQSRRLMGGGGTIATAAFVSLGDGISSSSITRRRRNSRINMSSDATGGEATTAAATSENSATSTTAASTATTAVKPFEVGSHEELMYAIGINLARQLGDVSPLVENGQELAQLAKGVLDVLVGRIDEQSQAKLLMGRKEDINTLLVERSNNIRKKLEEGGRAMLEQMSQTEGAYALPSGVVIHSLEPGPEGVDEGVRPTAASTVKVHYHGTLPDGSVFDSSLGGEPATFALGQVIPGWKEGLQKMHEGETAMLGIPPEAGYGNEGTPDGRIPGGATLFFKVQLLEVLSAGVGGSPKLLGADGNQISKNKSGGSGLLGVDGKPL